MDGIWDKLGGLGFNRTKKHGDIQNMATGFHAGRVRERGRPNPGSTLPNP